MKKLLIVAMIVLSLTACSTDDKPRTDPYIDANYAEIVDIKFILQGEPKTSTILCGKTSCNVTDIFPEAYSLKVKYDNGITQEFFMSKVVGEKMKVGDKLVFNQTLFHKSRPTIRQ